MLFKVVQSFSGDWECVRGSFFCSTASNHVSFFCCFLRMWRSYWLSSWLIQWLPISFRTFR